MTQRTKAALATQVSTLLADNTSGDISESDVRSVFTDTADSLVGGPASATDNTLPRFDSTTGQLIQGSGIVVADTTNAVSGIGMITLNDDAGLQTTTTTTDVFTLGAYDVNGTAYKTFATFTAADTPLCAWVQPAGATMTWNGGAIGGVTPAAGAFTTLSSSGAATLATVDGVLGSVTPAAATVTTLTATTVQCLSTANAGTLITMTLATTVLTSIQNIGRGTTAAGAGASARTTTGTTGATLYGSTAAITGIVLEGTMVVSTGGTIQLTADQNADHADESTFYTGSTLTMVRIA